MQRNIKKAERRINKKVYDRIRELEKNEEFLKKIDEEIDVFGVDYIKENAHDFALKD